jgi:hypothetical protein
VAAAAGVKVLYALAAPRYAEFGLRTRPEVEEKEVEGPEKWELEQEKWELLEESELELEEIEAKLELEAVAAVAVAAAEGREQGPQEGGDWPALAGGGPTPQILLL